MEDVFELQDRVTASVVAAIEPKLRSAEIERAQRKPTESLQAYDLLLRAQHRLSITREGLEEAIRLLAQATEIDPRYALAFAHLASCHWAVIAQFLVPRAGLGTGEAVRLARMALTNGADDPEVLGQVAPILALPGGDLATGLALVEKSISLNPNSAWALQVSGVLWAYAGDSETAIAHLERAMRLNPIADSVWLNFGFVLAHFVAGRYQEVLDWSEQSLRERLYTATLRYRAASLGLLGRLDEARQAAQQLRALIPDFTVARARARAHLEVDMHNVFKTPGIVDRFCEGLRRAGLPEV